MFVLVHNVYKLDVNGSTVVKIEYQEEEHSTPRSGKTNQHASQFEFSAREGIFWDERRESSIALWS